MSAIVIEEQVTIPARVVDLESFRRWARSDEFPQHGRFAYLGKEVWVDMSPEELFTHIQVKGRLSAALLQLVEEHHLGWFFPDGTLVSSLRAGLSTEPDGTFVSFDRVRAGKVRFVRGKKRGYMELEGSPDMVLEVVSETSVRKDTVVLPRLYWLAGVEEYWLVDAREAPPRFQILRRGRTGFVPTRPRSGWLTSHVFGKSFRLTSRPDELGYTVHTLHIK